MPPRKADQTVEIVGSIPIQTTTSGTSGTPAQHDDVAVTGAAGGVTLLAANASRNGVIVQNVGGANMRVTYDGTAPTASHGLQVTPGSAVELGLPECKGAVKAIREGATSTTASAVEVV